MARSIRDLKDFDSLTELLAFAAELSDDGSPCLLMK